MSNQKEFSTSLTKVNDAYFPMIERQLSGNGIKMDDYSKQCVINALSAINSVLDVKGITWNDESLDRSNITQNLLNVAALKLNAAASPKEVYFQIRNVKMKEGQRDVWKKQIEMGIEGDGNDAILSRFGRDIEQVMQFWLVRENDKFTYPGFNGIEMTPPTWQPTGKGDVIRVVYPIKKKDGTVDFHIAEREDVVRNLIAHINNNLMNETFGIAKDRWKATLEQKKQIDEKKKEIIDKVKKQGLMASLDDPDLHQYISPAWRDPQSRESMLIRKMRNNVVKRIPKDFGNAFVQMTYDETTDESYKEVRKEINENANKEVLDFETETPTENNEVEDAEFKEVDKETGEITETEEVSEQVEKVEKETVENQEDNVIQQEDLFTATTNGPDF